MRASMVAAAAIALGMASAAQASAQTATQAQSEPQPSARPAARIVDLQECITLGLANDAGLRANELETQIADARIHEMQAQYWPSLALQGGYSRLSDVAAGTLTVPFGGPGGTTLTFPPTLDNNISLRLSLQQPLFTGQRIAGSIRQAEALRDSARGDLSTTRLALRYTVTQVYWNLARLRTQADTIAQSVTQAETHLADAQKLLTQGMATTNDVAQAQMRVEDAKIDLASAENAREIARARLAILIGVPWSPGVDIPDTPTPPMAPPRESIQDLVSRALNARPEIRAQHARVTAQGASVEVARAGLFPSVFVTGDYTLADPNQRAFPQTDQFIGTWSIGLAVSIDLGRYPQVMAQEQQARSRLMQTQESLRQITDTVTTDVITAYLSLTEAVGRLARLHEETGQAEENDRVTQERYQQGVTLSSESLDAQILVVRALLRENGALFDCQLARAALDKAVGE